jgi:CO dehydrogenase/acetyl-CoA synthase epsilon subunit
MELVSLATVQSEMKLTHRKMKKINCSYIFLHITTKNILNINTMLTVQGNSNWGFFNTVTFSSIITYKTTAVLHAQPHFSRCKNKILHFKFLGIKCKAQ